MSISSKSVPNQLHEPFVSLLLSVADEKFFLGHCNSDWTGLGPLLEEDIAFSNIAQDEIAHAQELYKLAAAFTEPSGDTITEANRLAYARPANERLSARLVELVDDYDWAVAIARQFFYDHYDLVRLPCLQQSSYQPLADLAGKMIQEIQFHVAHFDGWVGKLAGGTDESKNKLESAIDQLWPEALGLFEPIADQQPLADAGLYPADDAALQQSWTESIAAVFADANLTLPAATTFAGPGGRQGRHTPALDDLLTDLVEVYNSEPGASW